MHITLEADYAVRIVLFLAKENKRCDANKISEETGVSLRFALKILRNLVSNGIAKSFKGSCGGYELDYNPKELTLYKVLEVTQGKYNFSRCLAEYDCTNPNIKNGCKVKKIFAEITQQVKEKLNSITISSLLE
ncbi:MAG: Rrf2 family transcriptional regulator [Oscillospiraceae bacterium]